MSHKKVKGFALILTGMLAFGVSEIKCTSLHEAAKYGDLEVVEYLVEKGANVNEKDDDGYTPLHVAAKKGYLEIVEYLVEKGAKINEKDKSAKTPLQLAYDNGNQEVVNYLGSVKQEQKVGLNF